MKRKLKIFLCALLSALMIFGSTSVAYAQNDVTPVVMVHGMGAFGLYKNPNTDKETDVGSFDINTMLSENVGIVFQLIRAAGGPNGDAEEIINTLSNIVKGFQDIACDENGNSAPDVGIASFWTDSLANHSGYLAVSASEPAICNQICKKIGAQNVYSFNYDWRLDACENADKLSDYIDMVKQQTGKSKVTLIGGSEGTIVVSAYLDAYGEKKNEINRVVFLNGAMQGVGVTKVFKQDLVFNKDVVIDYVNRLAAVYNSPDFDMATIKLLANFLSGGVDNLCKLLDEVANDKELLNRVYLDVLYPVVGCIPALWEFIPYDEFNECADKMSSIGFLDKNSGLYDKLLRYHGVQGRLENNILRLKNKGVDFAIIANYGTPAIPVTSAYGWQSDVLIDTKYASFGATVADFGETIKANGKYVSEDKIIDASTCLLPDQTWFVKGVQHMNFWAGTEVTDFVAEITTTTADLNIKSIENKTGVGQFIGTDTQQRIVSVTYVAAPQAQNNAPNYNSPADNDGESKSPLTGSDSCLYLSAALLILSIACLALMAERKRRLHTI